MAQFAYRAIKADGSTCSGNVEASSRADAVTRLRRTGVTPLALVDAAPSPARRSRSVNGKGRAAASSSISELAVLIAAGLQLDRALALAVENIEDRQVAGHLADILRDVREGVPLSRAMLQKPGLFSPTAIAMTEAGEANGRLGEALARLSETLEQEAELRKLIISSMIYPAGLLIVAVGVVLLMLLFVVPQFDATFANAAGKLPLATVVVMTASRSLRHYGLLMLLASLGLGFGVAMLLRQPRVRHMQHRLVLALPLLGELVRRIETARFARTLGALIDGDVPLPTALALARRTISNMVLGAAIARVAEGVKEGSGLTAPLAASGVLPRLAIGFLRTGEETSQLGMMLTRLATVLDREIRTRLERLIGILTPLITVFLGATVAGIIAAIMSAILGFNDLAVTP